MENHETHTICQKRFNQKGENLCCFCSPHSHCEFKEDELNLSSQIITEKSLREKISEILVKWEMPTRQVAINEIVKLLEEEIKKLK